MGQMSGDPLAKVAKWGRQAEIYPLGTSPTVPLPRGLATALRFSYTWKPEEKGGEMEFSSYQSSIKVHKQLPCDPTFRDWALTHGYVIPLKSL